MPLISVCLASYNGERFIAKQLQSILDQTLTDIEIVVSDDNSTDATPQILAEFAARDPRIRILPPHERLGFQKNFERAIASATGRYIAPCDQDDVWMPEKLAALLHHLQQTKVALVYSDSALIDDNGQNLGKRFLDPYWIIEGRDPMQFAFYNSVSGHAMLFDRTLLQDALPFPAMPFYDWWLGAVAATKGGISLLREPLLFHRVHATSVTGELREREAARERHDYFAINASDTVRLAAFGNLPGEAGEDYRILARLWPRRMTDYVIPELALFLLRHQTVFAARNSSPPRRFWRCLKRGLGVPLTNPLLVRRHRLSM